MSVNDEQRASKARDWRDELPTMRERYLHMYEKGMHTDCCFVVGPATAKEKREFWAHRLHLSNASAVFEAMLLNCVELSEANTGKVKVTDLSPRTFELLLRQAYADDVELTTFEEACDLANAAEKYQMKALRQKCQDCMVSLLASENVWSALDAARLLGHEKLEEACIKVMKGDTTKCISTDDFLQASEDSMALLLQQDELNVENELTLLNATVTWARGEAQRRAMLGDDEGVRSVLEPRLLPLLRLLVLTPEQFNTGPGLSDWLTVAEVIALNAKRAAPDDPLSLLPSQLSSSLQARVKPVSTTNNKSSYRFCIRSSESVLSNLRFQDIGCCANDKGNQGVCLHSRVVFKVKKNCRMLGIQIPSQLKVSDLTQLTPAQSYTESIDVAIYSCGNSLFAYRWCQARSKLSGVPYTRETEYNSTITVMLQSAVALNTENWYEIVIDFHTRGAYPNHKRSQRVRVEDVEFVFRTEQLEDYRSSFNDGVLQAIIFAL